jgi:hypothetical protein
MIRPTTRIGPNSLSGHAAHSSQSRMRRVSSAALGGPERSGARSSPVGGPQGHRIAHSVPFRSPRLDLLARLRLNLRAMDRSQGEPWAHCLSVSAVVKETTYKDMIVLTASGKTLAPVGFNRLAPGRARRSASSVSRLMMSTRTPNP